MTEALYPVASARVDTLVVDPRTDLQRWRTDYGGVVWLGAVPGTPVFYSRSGRIAGGFFLPDGHKYLANNLEDAVVQSTFSLFRSGGATVWLEQAQAGLVLDPRGGSGAYVYAAISANGHIPVAYTYRIIVLSKPGAVLPSPVSA